MTDDEAIAVVITPGAGLTDGLVRQVAAVLDRDLYQTRRLLASKVPRIAARFARQDEAETAVHRLADLGLVAFSCPDGELHEPLHVFRAVNLTFTEGAVVVHAKDGREFRLDSQDAFLIIDGIRHHRQQQEVVRKSKRINLMGMLLTGGIPMKKTVEERTYETTVRDERVIRLFAKNSADSCIEISQRGFDFSCLGPDMAPSSRRNIDLLAVRIREFFPEASFDDSLATPSPKNAIPVMHREEYDVDCRLIYRYRALGR